MRIAAALLLMLAAIVTARANGAPCGPETPCQVEGGDYHLMFPDGWDGFSPLPALIFFHGHRSSGATVFRSQSLKANFADRGYLIVAPNGAMRPGSDIRGWPARPPRGGLRDDVAFTLQVVEDVAERVPLIEQRVYVSGFSAGGSMAWMVGCHAGERFAGVVSVAGALRRPVPEDHLCPGGPVRLLHIHGFADAQVPFEGRGIRDWHQGDVFESLAIARATNGCRSNPDDIEIGETFRCRSWTRSCADGALKLCIHDGGHGLPRGWTDLARDWFEQ